MSSADTISLHNSNQYISMSNNDNRLSSSNSSITTTTTCCSDINNEEVYILPASPAINNISNSFNNINLNDNSNSTDNLNDDKVIINEMSVIVDISSSYPTTEQQSFFYDNNIHVNNDDNKSNNNQSYTNDNNIHIESNEIHNDNQNINVNIEVTEMSVNNNTKYDSTTTTINDCIQEDEMIIKNKKRSNANRFNNNTNISATNNNITINNNTTVNNIINNIATNVDNKINKSKYIIEVLDPIKEGTGLSARTTYLISTKFIQSNQLFYVRRRYKEFKKLFDEMTKLRGVNLSSFPKKQFKKFEDKVVEERRVAFEIILREMIEHEQVLMSPLFKEFIGVSDIPTQSPSNSASPIIGSTNDFVTINLK